MGKAGKPKTPTEILEQRGSWRAKTRPNEPGAGGELECPDWMSTKAKDIWKYVVPLLENMRTVGTIDSMQLARYCNTYAHYIVCEEFVAKNGRVMPLRNADGKAIGVQRWPQVTDMKTLGDQLRQMEMQFGMTPASRPEISVLPKRAQSKGERTTQDVISGLLND